jgi:hypothetical protein
MDWLKLGNVLKINSSAAPDELRFTKILQSKRDFRRRLAARPIEEKLAMLDAPRERALAIRWAQAASDPVVLPETPPP